MKLVLPLIASLFLSHFSFAAPLGGPSYSQFKKLSNAETQVELEKYTGKKDTWKSKLSWSARAIRMLPFQKKMTLEQERQSLSYVYAKESESALQDYTFAAYNSKQPAIANTVVTVDGDKRLAYNAFTTVANYNLRALVHFFSAIEYGDTDLETKKFYEFAMGFDLLSVKLTRAYQAAVELNMPLVIEFESSALMAQSPLTRMFLNYLVKEKTYFPNVSVTPNGGKIVAIDPLYAKSAIDNLNLFVSQFRLKVLTLRNSIFSDPEAKQRLLELIRNGEGLSGVLYTDERIQELAVQAKNTIPSGKTCNKLF